MKIRIIVAFILLSLFARGQSADLDSLKNIFYSTSLSEQPEKLSLAIQIAEQTKIFLPDTAVFYINEYLELYGASDEITSETLPLYLSLVKSLSGTNRKEEALELTLRVIDFSQKNKLRQPQLMSLLGASSLNLGLGRPDESNRWFQEALDFSKGGNQSEEALVHAFMAHLNINKNTDLEKYFTHAKKAFELFEAVGDTAKAMIMAFNLGSKYTFIEDEENAPIYFEKAIQYAGAVNALPIKAGAETMYAQMLQKQGKLEQAMPLSQSALQTAMATGNLSFIAKARSVLAGVHLAFDGCEKAIPHFEKAAEEFKALQDYESLKEILVDLKDCMASTGNYKKAFEVYAEYEAVKDSVLSIEKIASKQELTERFKTAEQQAEIELQAARLKRQRILNLLIGFTALSGAIIAFLLWRTSRQRKQTNLQLQQLDTAKSRFFANISHELRTPLTLILSPLENAIAKVKSKEASSNLKLAHSNGKKLLTLVNEILDLSKLESGEMTLRETPMHLEKLLRRIFFSYQSLAHLRGFTLSFSYHLPKDLGVKLDVGKFEKVINNLLSNAFKYSQIGGVISLRAEAHPQPLKGSLPAGPSGLLSPLGVGGKYLKIEVSDTGKGIPKEELEKIFERFYQAETEDEPLQGGTGIGLAYAREIARLFGGSLNVESEMGRGSTFVFSLPLKKSALKKLPDESEFINQEKGEKNIAFAPPLAGEKPHILVVEDNPEMSQFLVQSLSAHFHCSTAMDGKEALGMLSPLPASPKGGGERAVSEPLGKAVSSPFGGGREGAFDLITSDVMMPNMDGFTFLSEIHKLEKYRKTPVILLTARAMEEDKLRGFSLGVDEYLTKPFSTKELIARIYNLLKKKQVRESENELINENIQATETPDLSHSERFLKKAETLVLAHLDEGNYRVAELANDLAYSPRQLERFFKKETGMTPLEFIREIRLQKAYYMLEKRQFATVAEVRFSVGMENASYFAKKFRERFGKNPGEMDEV